VINFQTNPANYKHWKLSFDGAVARLEMDVNPDETLVEGYELKQTNFLKLKFFDDNTLKTELTWELKGEVLHVDLVELFDGDTTKMEYNTNDNSGMIKVYEGTQLTTEIVWNSDGSGTFTDHLANESFTF